MQDDVPRGSATGLDINEVRRIIHTAFYRIVRVRTPPELDQFFRTAIQDTWPKERSPSGWPDYWWETVAVEIQTSVMSRGEFIRRFDGKWLKDNKNKAWQALSSHAEEWLAPLGIGLAIAESPVAKTTPSKSRKGKNRSRRKANSMKSKPKMKKK